MFKLPLIRGTAIISGVDKLCDFKETFLPFLINHGP